MISQDRNRTVAYLPVLSALRKAIDDGVRGAGVACSSPLSGLGTTTAGSVCCLSRRGRAAHVAVARHALRRSISRSKCKGSVAGSGIEGVC